MTVKIRRKTGLSFEMLRYDYSQPHPWSEAQVVEMQAAAALAGGVPVAPQTEAVAGLLPISGWTLPLVLRATGINGKLPTSLIPAIDARGGKGFVTMGRCWRAMQAAALKAGFDLWYTGVYRSYQQQVDLLSSRASPVYPGPGKYSWTRTWQGVTWYGNGAPVATPGTSNHGLGLAIDAALKVSGSSVAQPISPAINWLIAHAATYGFSWESQIEPWHIRMVTGDSVPAAVLAYEANPNPNPNPDPNPDPNPTPEEDVPALVKDARGNIGELLGGYLVHIQNGNYVTACEQAGIKPTLISNALYDALPKVEASAFMVQVVTPPTDLSAVAKSTELQPLAKASQFDGLAEEISAGIVVPPAQVGTLDVSLIGEVSSVPGEVTLSGTASPQPET